MKKIAIIYEKSNKIGHGHYFRSKRLFNLIRNKFNTKLFRVKSAKELKIIQKKKFDLFILENLKMFFHPSCIYFHKYYGQK